MCEIILSLFVVGAVNTEPYWMHVDYLDNGELYSYQVPEYTYRYCYNIGEPFQKQIVPLEIQEFNQ